MRFAKAKSVLKANLEVQVSHRIHSSKGAVVVDGNAILWCLNWPKDGFPSHLVQAMYEYVEKKLLCCYVYLVLDRYKKLVLKDQLVQTE